MQEVRGIWLPEGDTQLSPQIAAGPTVAGKGTFQWKKFAAAIPLIRDFRHAVDVGAHVGTWSRVMALLFSEVTAFEPLAAHAQCFVKNVASSPACAVTLYDCALGERMDVTSMKVKGGKSSTSYISADGGTAIRVHSLDSFQLQNVDFMKVDTEGFEAAVVRGGEETIRRCKPTIIVEQKPDNAERHGFTQFEAAELLRGWGAEEAWNIGNDICLRWKLR